ncbi:hypothetical protein VTJ83DRAFT_7271 [Remersonia thermophila]|uniref:Uncharacterized protein n=1 Tax=Remersonia thermophila TaxID=72144 RepID=A0ABR4D327_9PEZI
MATTRGVAGVLVQHVSTFLLFAAALLLVITCISSPVTRTIDLLRVELNGTGTSAWGERRQRVVSFGTFGWCEIGLDGNGTDICSSVQVGYSPCAILSAPSNLTYNLTLALPSPPWGSAPIIAFSDDARQTAAGLTRGMILHPVAGALCFLAFLVGLHAGTRGSGPRAPPTRASRGAWRRRPRSRPPSRPCSRAPWTLRCGASSRTSWTGTGRRRCRSIRRRRSWGRDVRGRGVDVARRGAVLGGGGGGVACDVLLLSRAGWRRRWRRRWWRW